MEPNKKKRDMKIEPYEARKFLPKKIDLTDVKALVPVFDQLKQQLEAVDSVEALEQWLRTHSEVNAALAESGALINIAMTCQTDDPEREKAYLHLVEVVDPWLKPRQFELCRMLAASPYFSKLPALYDVYRRSVETQVRLYREENVPRQTEEAKLCQQYQKINGAMTVQFDGKEQTLPQMARVQEETDRARRQQAWELVVGRRLQDRETLDNLFEQLLALRQQIARAAGFEDYRAYTFANYERFDYTPEDCLAFHDAVEKKIVPLARALQAKRKEKLGVNVLRPWDLAVDPEQNSPLRPFGNVEEFLEKTGKIFSRLDHRLADFFQVLRERELVDLENRKGKAPGGYQSSLSEARQPFIFMNAVGVHRDVETLLHEAGHAFHTQASVGQPLHAYRHAPIEFCEVASMSMELFGAPYLTEFYTEKEARRARRDHLEGIIKFFPWMATVDAFQHWIYTHPGHTRAERGAAWTALMDRFGGIESYAGHEAVRESSWHRQLHIFEIPFYYVEYGIAQLGALQLWKASKAGLPAAIDGYLNGLRLGGSRPLPELFAAAGIRFDFTEKTIAPLMATVQEELALLD
jgi:oligoendopeptidase F